MKLGLAALAVIITITFVIGGIGNAVMNVLLGSGSSEPSHEALAEIPADYLSLYRAAASACPGLDWTVLAAIGDAESKHGRGSGVGITSGENAAGAAGPMQFLKATFGNVVAQHRIPPGGSTPASRYNAHDAIYAAAFYLCDSGAPKDIRKALFAYNHSNQYVESVLAQAKRYQSSTTGTGDCNQIQAASPAAIAAIRFACAQLGLPYVWGGNGPAAGHRGFDCSGLTKAAYAAAGVHLPRTAQTQYNAGPLVPEGHPLLPGDLIFYGTRGNVHHVGLYLGASKMVHAPTFGQPVQIRIYRWKGDDFLTASRPSN
ncbi:bifunctional lytic transglycosylase/C40 family peptidase [Allokutzneria sp. NRRL B-24872]|uniref:C40 family peptidase n=1 Tax=Allokutzneria sp. NRRL B-24872 TaxID=1137961 RepID=UPI000A3922FE|nr:bifunctional lytic transglycosylase/C40 family peptidase [Allokutzneria sp. NRRL B-24872]